MLFTYLLYAFLLLAALAAVYAVFVEPRLVKTENIEISVDKDTKGQIVSILHLSDLHFKKRDAWKIKLLQGLAGEKFDLVLITGDSIDEDGGIENFVSSIKNIKPGYGTFCVLGNHDFYKYTIENAFLLLLGIATSKTAGKKDIATLTKLLEEEGIHILRNRSAVIKDINLSVIGVDDFCAGMDDVEKAGANIGGETLNILLAHHPDSIIHAPARLIDLALCGHTHGGQVCVPFVGALKTMSSLHRKNASGFIDINGIKTYVSRGLSNCKYLPFRFFCRPELTKIKVISGKKA